MKRMLTALTLFFLSASAGHADYVTGLNPYGDNFLSLRTGPGTDFQEIERMGPGTQLQIIGSSGAWMRVRLDNGTEGWAFGRYIARGEHRNPAPPPSEPLGEDGSPSDDAANGFSPDGPQDGGSGDAVAPDDGMSGDDGGLPPLTKKKPRKLIPNGTQSDSGDLE